jgi:hypothetical protein
MLTFKGACFQVLSQLSKRRQLVCPGPGTFRLLQLIDINHTHQRFRGVAQPARQHMEAVTEDPRLAEATSQPLVQPGASTTLPYAPPTGVKKTFYKRKLPCPPATEFSSVEGVQISCGI